MAFKAREGKSDENKRQVSQETRSGEEKSGFLFVFHDDDVLGMRVFQDKEGQHLPKLRYDS